MSRLKVGDIEIDGHQVRIGAVAAQARSVPLITVDRTNSPGPASLPTPKYAFLDAIPLSPGFLLLSSCIATAVGLFGAILTWPPRDISDYVLHGSFLIPIGLGLAFLGFLKAFHSSSLTVVDASVADSATEEFISQLGSLLRHEDRTHTIEWVQTQLGWSPTDVVKTLAWLRARDELREEIDIDSGHYYYVATSRPKDLDARLRSTTGRH